ncbi:winged helix-turn-helix domain-containing protein [Deinococcus sp. QL22]|uniref:winged helix-turn-helix domain-containing protein n=1 Tax=Deinococcus sp. QL22 TaxID=2939437 RepID=UPI0020177991|nr:winged helix-turn-helix domain-containing protein [Deinococcus sp. QL22]UQN07512.1 winged helix-turn-helix domain-containing protein [Deinococcus sp. QL22]
MTAAQQTQLRITDSAQARALRQQHHFLARFLAPHSPSDIAASVGMAANLAHHHARKLAALGLLIRLERQAGKVAYQLAAREFLIASSLLPPEDAQGNGTRDMQELSAAFLHAYERSWSVMQGDVDGTFGFGDHLTPAPPISLLNKPADEPYPTYLDALTLRLTPERYGRLAHALSNLIADAAAEPISNEGQPCTLAVLAFEGVPGESGGEMKGLSRRLNSFLGAEVGERTTRRDPAPAP